MALCTSTAARNSDPMWLTGRYNPLTDGLSMICLPSRAIHDSSLLLFFIQFQNIAMHASPATRNVFLDRSLFSLLVHLHSFWLYSLPNRLVCVLGSR